MGRSVFGFVFVVAAGCDRLFELRAVAPLPPDAERMASAYEQAVLADTPLVYFRLEETSGGIAFDAVAQQEAIYEGATEVGLGGARDLAARWNGVSTRLVLPSSLQFPNRQSFSAELWANPTLVTDNVRFILDQKSQSGVPGGFALYFRDLFLQTERENAAGAGEGYASTSTFPINTWTHIVMTYDGSVVRLYVDGTLRSSAASTSAMPSHPDSATTAGDLTTHQSSKFEGALDEIAFYAYALPAARVAAHYDTQ